MPGMLIGMRFFGLGFFVFVFFKVIEQSVLSVVEFDPQGSNVCVFQVVLPTFILERRSLLEMYADFFAHPDLFVRYLTEYCSFQSLRCSVCTG